MARSLKKGPYIHPKLYKKVIAASENPSAVIQDVFSWFGYFS